MSTFNWPLVDEFLNRDSEQSALEAWWASPQREPLAMLGRRRVGKSWLFRKFAHGKDAELLVSEQLPPGAMLSRFADQLESRLGVRPDLPDVPALFRALFRAAAKEKFLVVIDEFPWLLGTGSDVPRNLTSIQAVMEEERDTSKLKLILCGSEVETMEALFTEKNPLHGRLQRLEVRPMQFADAALFLSDLEPLESLERFAVAGGMPMYLSRFGAGSLKETLCKKVLDRDAPLWNEGRAVVEQELREPRIYFAILEQLSRGAKEVNDIAQPLRIDTTKVSKYLATLSRLRLVARVTPFGADEKGRTSRWLLDDPFLRFWFRYVFPYQTDLESGLSAESLFDAEIAPTIADHTAPVFETWCTQWLRQNRSDQATRFGNWWGPAANALRRTKERSTEEIDVVGARSGTITLVAEAKWTRKPLTPAILNDLETYKIPALRDSGMKVAARPCIVLFSRGGYSTSLVAAAAEHEHIELVDVAAELADPHAGRH